jgi:hypothetical protein
MNDHQLKDKSYLLQYNSADKHIGCTYLQELTIV